MRRVKVYLAGPINGCNDGEAMGWREKVVAGLEGFDILDPMTRDFRGVEGDFTSLIVEGDKADIDSCDVLLAFCWQVSVGTSMEVLYAWDGGKAVIVVVPHGSVSPWLRYHAEVVRTLDAALDIVRGGAWGI